jgi:hypothetical protein
MLSETGQLLYGFFLGAGVAFFIFYTLYLAIQFCSYGIKNAKQGTVFTLLIFFLKLPLLLGVTYLITNIISHGLMAFFLGLSLVYSWKFYCAYLKVRQV